MARLQYGVGEAQHLGKLAGSEVKSGLKKCTKILTPVKEKDKRSISGLRSCQVEMAA